MLAWIVVGIVWLLAMYVGWRICYVAGEADKRDGLK